MPSYRLLPPNTDEYPERIDNSEHVAFTAPDGAKRVILYDSNGTEVSPGAFASAIVSGTKTVTTAGVAVQVTAISTVIKGVWVCADLLAGFTVTVGDSSVVGNASGMKGIVLTPGNPPVFLPIKNLNLLWVDSQSNGGKLSYLYQT